MSLIFSALELEPSRYLGGKTGPENIQVRLITKLVKVFSMGIIDWLLSKQNNVLSAYISDNMAGGF